MRNKFIKWATVSLMLIRVGTSLHVNPEMVCATARDGRGSKLYLMMPQGSPTVIKSDWSYELVIQALAQYTQAIHAPAQPAPQPEKPKEKDDAVK